MASSPTYSSLERETLDPSAIAEYISFNSCPQFHKYRFDDTVSSDERKKKDWKEAFEPLNLLLAKDGQDFEEGCEDFLDQHSAELKDHTDITDWRDSKPELKNIIEHVKTLSPTDDPVITTQTRFGPKIEEWPVYGDADVVVFWPQEDNTVRIRVIDIKAAYDEKTYQQIQVGVYTVLLKKFLRQNGLEQCVTVEGGVWNREDELTDVTPDDFPKFDKLEARESDVRRLLKEGGEFDRHYTADNADIDYQLAPKCQGCSYREACYTNAIENESLALLGLSRGEQQTFKDYGVDTLHKLASLAYPESDPRPYEYGVIQEADRGLYNKLKDEPGIGERLPRYIQKAQALLSKLDPGHMFARSDKDAAWIQGSGDGILPADDPPFDADLPFDKRSMIRVYLHVERDHRRDRVAMLSGYVTASQYEDAGFAPREVSEISKAIPDNEQKAQQIEETLLDDFFSDLFSEIQTVGQKMGYPDRAPVHWYFYTHNEATAVVDAVKRAESLSVAPVVRDFLGLRHEITQADMDQPMVSIVKSEIESRKATTVQNPGLLPMMEEFYPDQNFFSNDDWKYTRSDGVDVNLRDVFSHKLFDYRVPYTQTNDSIELYPGEGVDPDGYYPSRVRQTAQIPLEYVWSAQGKMTDEWVEDAKERFGGQAQNLEPFRWVDANTEAHKITDEDVMQLGKRFAHALAHIERGLDYRNTSLSKKKHPVPLSQLNTFTLGDASVVRAAREFLELEYNTQRNEQYSLYQKQPAQRVRSGSSIPVLVKDVTDDDGSSDITIEGRLLYDAMFGVNSDRIANSCRQKGDDGATSGSWMVANEITSSETPAKSGKPHMIEKGVSASIVELNVDSSPRTITFTVRDGLPFNNDFNRSHRSPVTEPEKAERDDHNVLFEAGKIFILDPQTDDLTGQRSLNVLEEPDNNTVGNLLQGMADGAIQTPTTNAFSTTHVNEFCEWSETGLAFTPNKRQQNFMKETDGQISLLQGPPGTGKTSLALAPTIVSRVYSFARDDKKLSGIVAGESNKAVDEVLGDVADTVQQFKNSSHEHAEILNELKLVRLVTDEPENPHPEVDYINYSDDVDAVDEIIERLRNQNTRTQQTFGEYGTRRRHTLIFSTPSRIYGLINKLDRSMDDSMKPEDWVKVNASFFDMLAIDEASMMRLPSFLLAGAFLHDNAQVLVAGDQRQMPPVAQHDWEKENRRIIEEYVPYLSTLDYLRFLSGQEVDAIHEPDEAVSANATVPMTQLQRTYRCHTEVAKFLQRHVYTKDGINYSSEETATLQPTSPATPALEHVLDVDSPLVLIMHGNDTNQQANPEEAAIAGSIIDGVNPADNAGIVTPHNAQRGLLNSQLPTNTEVDTVERFQGGQRDMIIVSATASDPDFLESESDFILNPNRLNVAMSRMKKKLVVIASREVFNLVPQDVKKYNRSLLWKGLYEDMKVNDSNSDWDGELNEFTPNNFTMPVSYDDTTPINVFTL